ncbi:MAG TPA: heme-copper oxidase subunit III [Vicinamibacteria bacterium]|nr:heme-copper oxidase subunit III [Vicinamibacteria bacterium]
MAETLARPNASGGGGLDVLEPGFGGDGRPGEPSRRQVETAKLGLWIALGSVTMLFAAFTSAYLVRSSGDDWVPLVVPPILYPNSLVLIASSVSMEIARRRFVSFWPVSFRKWLLVTAALGVIFLAGQVFAWKALATSGVYLTSHPHSSFFYVLTGVHGVHLVAGVLVILYVLVLATRRSLTPGESSSPELAATYWHFVDVLWLYLFVVLFYL